MAGSTIGSHNKVVHHCKRSLSSLILSVFIMCVMPSCTAKTINTHVNVGIHVRAL